MTFPIILKEQSDVGEDKYKKVLTQEEPMLWRVSIWTQDAMDWDWKEFTELTNATEVFDLVEHIDDLHKW